jgi:cytidyltransferase-like protein
MKIVYAYVCGDILHTGHLLQLQNGKALGDKLIVGVLTDEAIMEKKQAPAIPFTERMRMVQGLDCVDCVVPQADYSPLNNVRMIKPDILMESESHIGNKYIETLEQEFNGRIIFTPYCPGPSSTSIKDKIRNGNNEQNTN